MSDNRYDQAGVVGEFHGPGEAERIRAVERDIMALVAEGIALRRDVTDLRMEKRLLQAAVADSHDSYVALEAENRGIVAQKEGAIRSLARAMEELTEARKETEQVQQDLAFAHSEWEKVLIERNALRQRVAELEARQRWIPFSEQQPPDDISRYTVQIWRNVFYWLPLPPAPEVES